MNGSSDRIKVEHIEIDADYKERILGELDKLGVNEKTLFPEIERAARYITGTLSAGNAVSELI